MTMLKKIWKFISSMRFAIILLVVLAVACSVASLVTQGQSYSWYAERYSERAAKVFPHVEFVVVPGQGHGYRGEARDEAMARELAFFKRECGMA